MSYGQFSTHGNYGLVRSYSRTLGRAIVLAVPRNVYEQKNPAAQVTTHRLSGDEYRWRTMAGLGATVESTLTTNSPAIPTPPTARFPTPPLRFAPIDFRNAILTPAPSSGAPVSQPSAPVISTQPSIAATPVPPNASAAYPGETYTDPATGNVWAWNTEGWQLIQPGASTQPGPVPSTYANSPTPANVALQSTGGGATAQAGSPVPVGYPTNQAYTDSSGNIWTYTATGGWQITGTASAAPAGGDWAASITSWLQASTIISGVPNFWPTAAAAAVILFLSSGKRR